MWYLWLKCARFTVCLIYKDVFVFAWSQGLEVSSKEVGVGNLETSDSGVGFNTALPLDTDTDAPDQILDSEAASITAPAEPKPSPPSTATPEPSAPPAMEIKPTPKVSPLPEKKKTPPVESKLETPKSPEVKLSPAPSPEPKASRSLFDPKSSPGPEPKPAAPKAPTPTPETKSALAPTPEPPKPTTPEPITNGTPETGPDLKSSPGHAELTRGSTPKAVAPKTPEVELKTSGAKLDVKTDSSKDAAVAADSTTSTTWKLLQQSHISSHFLPIAPLWPTEPSLPHNEETTGPGVRTFFNIIYCLNYTEY